MSELTLKDYVDAAGHSSSRSRWIFLVMVTTSVLTFSSFWNARQGSWLNERVRVSHQAMKWLGWDKTVEDSLRKANNDDLDLFNQSREWANLRGISSKKDSADLANLITTLEHLRTENIVIIKIPFFGIVLDVNDIGMLGGLAFVMITMMYRLSLARELNDITALFATLTDTNRKSAYEVLSMMQVLTTPPVENKSIEWYWNLVFTKLLFLLPVAVHSIVFFYDKFWTYEFGRSISETNTSISFVVSLVCLILIVFNSFACIVSSFQMDFRWRAQAKMLKIIKP